MPGKYNDTIVFLFSRHCSRRAPAVFAFRNSSVLTAAGKSSSFSSELDTQENIDERKLLPKSLNPELLLSCILPEESERSIFEFWG